MTAQSHILMLRTLLGRVYEIHNELLGLSGVWSYSGTGVERNLSVDN